MPLIVCLSHKYSRAQSNGMSLPRVLVLAGAAPQGNMVGAFICHHGCVAALVSSLHEEEGEAPEVWGGDPPHPSPLQTAGKSAPPISAACCSLS